MIPLSEKEEKAEGERSAVMCVLNELCRQAELLFPDKVPTYAWPYTEHIATMSRVSVRRTRDLLNRESRGKHAVVQRAVPQRQVHWWYQTIQST